MAEQDTSDRSRVVEEKPTQPCPLCTEVMVGIRGSRDAICPNCGFKDSCCY